jgi:hypothetical protein
MKYNGEGEEGGREERGERRKEKGERGELEGRM